VENQAVALSRTVRFMVSLAAPSTRAAVVAGRHNTFAGWPSVAGLGAYYELVVGCTGYPDPVTGYMLNISAIDKAVRDHALPIIEQSIADRLNRSPGEILAQLLSVLQPALHDRVASIRWQLSPYYSVAMATAAPDRVLISQQFEFSASHRLNVASLSPNENQRTFGKCNNEHGHGHNYRLAPVVSVPLTDESEGQQQPLALPELERIVDQTILQRFDHKHLNLDIPEFAALNPSVENIAKVCFNLLAGPLQHAGARLERVTVWETEKTSCTYPAP
jgi:6-pyruvoyltetrahydropterin/6-carboxytetrahydropterin synthase